MPLRLCLFFLCLLAGLLRSGAQPLTGPNGASGIDVVRVGVLPDRSYSLERIRADTTLAFAPADSLHPAQAHRFWLKLALTNRSRYAAAAQLTVLPNLDNTLYYFDEDARAWRSQRAGQVVPTDSQRLKGLLPLRLPGQATTTVYLQVNLNQQPALPAAIRLQTSLEPEAAVRQRDTWFTTAWAVSLGVLGLLLLTNLLAYFRFRDRVTRYYACTQVGAMLYVTAFRGLFKVWFPGPIFSHLVLPSGWCYAYSLNSLLMHLSVVLLLLGAVQLTRAYLHLRARLPRLDSALRYALWGYLAFSAVVAAVNLGGFYLDNYSLLLDNVLVLAVAGLLLATSVVAYRHRLPAARTYLLANAVPLLLVLLVALYHVGVGISSDGNHLLPDLAIVAHALGFSAAINIRLQNLQQTLLTKEQEASFLALDIQAQELRNREIVLKNQHIQTALLTLQRRQQAREQHAQQLSADNEQHQATNQELQVQLEANQRELASTTLYVQQKNALLAELKQQIQELNAQSPHQQKELSGIKSILQTSLYLDEDWSKFKLHFEQVHPRFFEELQARYPALTKNEQRLYCYFHIHLATKEIAALLNIDPASVRRAKTRLYKKIAAADVAADVAAGRTPPAALPDESPAGK